VKPLSNHRRTFVKQAAIVAGSFALPRFSIGQSAATSKLRIACIGIGGIGGVGAHAVKAFLTENIVAFCDVDENYAAPIFGLAPKAKRFRDFREMLSKMGNEIDAVTIATPDHTHFPIAMMALKHGKHVFLEKPLAHRIEEIRLLQQAARKAGVITIMGNQGHAKEGIRLVKEWTHAGILGDVREVHAWTDTPVKGFFEMQSQIPPATNPVPATLDWDLWLGPAKERPFSRSYLPQLWRGWWDFGSGMIGDNMPHTLDAPFWALELGSPHKVEVEMPHEPNPQYDTFNAKVTFHFAARGKLPPVKLFWYQGADNPPQIPGISEKTNLDSRGMLMVGEHQTLYAPGLFADSPRLLDEARWNELRAHPIAKTIPRVRGSHYQEWIDGIRSHTPCGSDFAYGGSLSEIAVLGALAMHSGKSFEWNSVNLDITNHPELNPMLRHLPREGWDFR
jgi:predicted dehydrogenase